MKRTAEQIATDPKPGDTVALASGRVTYHVRCVLEIPPDTRQKTPDKVFALIMTDRKEATDSGRIESKQTTMNTTTWADLVRYAGKPTSAEDR